MSWLDTALRRQPNDTDTVSETVRERAETKGLRHQERAERDTRRREAAAQRRQVAGQLASAALSWGLNAWLEGGMWLCLFGGLVVLYIGSYTDLAATFAAFGYDGHISWLMPLGIDLPVTASVLAQMLAGRWKCNWWVRVRLSLLTAVIAPLTLTGNALRGAIDNHGRFTFHVDLWMDLVAFAVPGLGVVLIGYVASMMQGERAELTKRRLEAEVYTGAPPEQNAPAIADEEPATRNDMPDMRCGSSEQGADDEPQEERNPQPRVPARAEVQRLLSQQQGALSDDQLHRLAKRVARRTGVSIPHARRLLRDEHRLHVVAERGSRDGASVEAER